MPYFGCKPEVKGIILSPYLRWDDNIKVNLREIGSEYANRIYVAQQSDQ